MKRPRGQRQRIHAAAALHWSSNPADRSALTNDSTPEDAVALAHDVNTSDTLTPADRSMCRILSSVSLCAFKRRYSAEF